MFLKDLGQTADTKISKINRLLSEQFGFSINGYPEKAALTALLESAYESIVTIRGNNKKFHLDPEYIKFLGIKDVIETMISEGIYAEGPAYQDMQDFVNRNVHDLMDSGYSLDDTVNEVMNRYRLDSRFAFPDEHVHELVMQCAAEYVQTFTQPEITDHYQGDMMPMPSKEIMLSPDVFESFAGHFGVRANTSTARRILENKIAQYCLATGKSPRTIVEFFNKLSCSQLSAGITLFEQKVKQHALNETKKNHKAQGTKESKAGHSRKALQKVMEEVDLNQAEVAVAAKSMSSELQDQVEKLGRMLNEDLPAIVEQIRAEMGAQTAVAFRDSASQVISGHLEATRQAQQSMEQAVASITGEETVGAAPAPEAGAEAGAAPEAGAEAGDIGQLDLSGLEGGAEEEAGLGRAEV